MGLVQFALLPAAGPQRGNAEMQLLQEQCRREQASHLGWRKAAECSGAAAAEGVTVPVWDSRCTRSRCQALCWLQQLQVTGSTAQGQQRYIKGWEEAQGGLDGRDESNYRMKGKGREVWSGANP